MLVLIHAFSLQSTQFLYTLYNFLMYTDFRSIISIIDILVSGALYAHITRHCHRIIIGTASGALVVVVV